MVKILTIGDLYVSLGPTVPIYFEELRDLHVLSTEDLRPTSRSEIKKQYRFLIVMAHDLGLAETNSDNLSYNLITN